MALRPLSLAIILLVASLSACLGGRPHVGPQDVPVPTHPEVQIYDALGKLLPSAPGWPALPHLVQRYTGQRGGEPNIGVTKDGAVFVTARHAVLKSTDHGLSWTEVFNLSKALPQTCDPVTPPAPAPCPVTAWTRSSDSMLWVDPDTDRIFADFMTGLWCSNMVRSDDHGATWVMKPMTCGTPGNDHQKVATGRWHQPLAPLHMNPTYADAVYYCYNKAVPSPPVGLPVPNPAPVPLGGFATGDSFCAISYDGGTTFPVDRLAVASQADGCGGINGHPASAPDGTLFLPITLGCDGPVVGVSEDNGLTWMVRHGPTTVGAEELDPDVTVTPDGTAYMQYRGTDHLQYLVRSKDHFATWDGPWRASPPDVTSTVFAGITSGSDGRVAMAYLGTRDTKEEPSKSPNATRWHVYVTMSLDASAATPTFVTTQVSPDTDPVQIGCVWLSGGSNPCRNLLDFIDMTSDRDGRLYVVLSDGCRDTCAGNPEATNLQSRNREINIVTMTAGPSLVAEKGVLAE